MVTTYDPEAARLAEYFLGEDDDIPTTPERVHALALAIQNAIEEWFADHPARRPPVPFEAPRLRLLLATEAPDDRPITSIPDDDDRDQEDDEDDDPDAEQEDGET